MGNPNWFPCRGMEEWLLALEGGALALALPGCLAMEELGHLSTYQLPPVSICKTEENLLSHSGVMKTERRRHLCKPFVSCKMSFMKRCY